VDTLLTQIFPVVPFLSSLILNTSIKMSRRALNSLASEEAAHNLRVLKGIKWEDPPPYFMHMDDPFLSLLRNCENLEELEISGPGLPDDDDVLLPGNLLTTPPPTPEPPLSFPKLRILVLLQLPKGCIMESLAQTTLPSLRHLVVTPYDEVLAALTSSLVSIHGKKLSTLAFHTPKIWPPVAYDTPSDIFETAPNLRALSLTLPIPDLSPPSSLHPLNILSIPRPSTTFLWKLDAWLYLGLLPNLKEIHMRETTWIRSGVSPKAAETGVQGDMREWMRRLRRWKVRVLDSNGKE